MLSLLLGAAAIAAVMLGFGAGSAAASGTVTCPPNNGADLQAAINGGGTVTVNGTCHGNFDVATNVTIQGGSPGATLDGDGGGSVLTIHNDVVVTIKNLKITDGDASYGGGIHVYDCGTTVYLQNVQVTANEAADGGGIYGDCVQIYATASGVNLNSAPFGGGIEVYQSILYLTNSTVNGNVNGEFGIGGGVATGGGSYLNMTGSSVSYNQAAYEGGGLLVGDTTADITASSIHHNTVNEAGLIYGGGGIWMIGAAVNLTSSKVSWNSSTDYGGGIANYGGGAPGLVVKSSTIDHNTAAFSGGGIYSEADSGDAVTSIDGSTISFNRVLDGDGGGISNYGTCQGGAASVVITNSSLGGNLALTGEGGALYNTNGGACLGGEADVTLSSTFVGQTGSSVNANRAAYGGGIFNENGDGLSSLSLQSGTRVVHNSASVNGGGVLNCGGAALVVSPGVVIFLNSPNNLVKSAVCP